MKQKKKLGKRVFSFLLCFIIAITTLNLPAFTDVAKAAHKCPGCEEVVDGDPYCKECYQCKDCVDLCEDCGEICSFCGDVLFYEGLEMFLCGECAEDRGYDPMDAFVVGECYNCSRLMISTSSDMDPDHANDLYPDEEFAMQSEYCNEHCEDCFDFYRCPECEETCGLCNDLCDECGLCENCWFHCPECEECVGEDDNYCFNCNMCLDCVELNGLHCTNCGACSEDKDFCFDCVLCIECAVEDVLHCSDCNACGQETEICPDCGFCIECGIINNEHCSECEVCFSEVGRCESGAYHCTNCCLICDDCGECFFDEPEKFCKDCGLCIEDAESIGAHCVYCDGCFITLHQCKTCVEEPVCIDCCRKVFTKRTGCNHDICANDTAKWESHVKEKHVNYKIEDNTLYLMPASDGYIDFYYIDAPWQNDLKNNKFDTIVIEDGVDRLSAYAFYEKLDGDLTVYFAGDAPEIISDRAFCTCRNVTIYYPKGNSSYNTCKSNTFTNSTVTWIEYEPASIKITKAYPEMATKETKKIEVEYSSMFDDSLTWSSSDETVATVDQMGNVTAKVYGKVTITAALSKTGKSVSYDIQTRFYDVNGSNVKGDPNYQYYYDPVYWAAENGITKGYDGGVYFGPERLCTRQELLIFLWRIAGQPEPMKDARNYFSDVTDGTQTATNKSIAWAYENGITKGYNEGGKTLFKPKNSVTRQETMIFLWRVAGEPKASGSLTFSDCKNLDKNSATYKSILWGSKNGITGGYPDNTFGLTKDCLREAIVTFLFRFDRLS